MSVLLLWQVGLLAAGADPVASWDGIWCRGISFSADGKWLAAAGRAPVSAKTLAEALKPTDGLIKVWDVASGKEVFQRSDPAKAAACLALAPRAPLLAVGYEDRSLQFSGPAQDRWPLIVWDVAKRKEVLTLAAAYRYQAVAFSPDGKWLASAATFAGEKTTTLTLWRMPAGKEQRRWTLPREEVWGIDVLAFSADGRSLGYGGGRGLPQTDRPNSTRGAVGVIDLDSGKVVARFAGHADSVGALAFSADGKYLACGAGERDPSVRVYDWKTKEVAVSFTAHTFGARAVAFGPDSKTLFTSGLDRLGSEKTGGVWKAWELPKGRLLHSEKTGHLGPGQLALSPDVTLLAVGSAYGVRLWKVPAELRGRR